MQTVLKSLEHRMVVKSKSQNDSKSFLDMHSQPQTEKVVEILKSKFFLYDVCFEKAIESILGEGVITKTAEISNRDKEMSIILSQLRQSMCQNFVSLAKQQAINDQNYENMKEQFEQELSQRNESYFQLGQELSKMQKKNTDLEQAKEDAESQIKQLQNNLSQLQAKFEEAQSQVQSSRSNQDIEFLQRETQTFREKFEQADEELKQTSTLLVGSKMWAEKLDLDLKQQRDKIYTLEQSNLNYIAKNERLISEQKEMAKKVKEDTDFLQNEAETIQKEYEDFKIEALKYKNQAEKMIENLHAENSQQTEYIVKHSIQTADRTLQQRTKFTQTEMENVLDDTVSFFIKSQPQNYTVNTTLMATSENLKLRDPTPFSAQDYQSGRFAQEEQNYLNKNDIFNRRTRKARSKSPRSRNKSSQIVAEIKKKQTGASQTSNTVSFSTLKKVNGMHKIQSKQRSSSCQKLNTITSTQNIPQMRQRIGSPYSPRSTHRSNLAAQVAHTCRANGTLSPLSSGRGRSQGTTTGRGLSLKQTKELILELFASKNKHDKVCLEKMAARETMEQHMFTFLNQRFGLKQLIMDWASALMAAVKNYSALDHEVKLFGQILKNQLDEEFWLIQLHVKATVQSLVKQYVREKYISKQADTIATIVEDIFADRTKIDLTLWMKIIDRMYEDHDVAELRRKILAQNKVKAAVEKDYQRNDSRNTRKAQKENNSSGFGTNREKKRATSKDGGTSHRQVSHRSTSNSDNGQISACFFTDFLNCVQDFQLNEHMSFLGNFMKLFQDQDTDKDGIINAEQFSCLLKSMQIGIDDDQVEVFLKQIDPFETKTIPLSDVIQLLSNQQTTVQQLQQIRESTEFSDSFSAPQREAPFNEIRRLSVEAKVGTTVKKLDQFLMSENLAKIRDLSRESPLKASGTPSLNHTQEINRLSLN